MCAQEADADPAFVKVKLAARLLQPRLEISESARGCSKHVSWPSVYHKEGRKSSYVDHGCCFSACFQRDRLWGCGEKKRTVGGQQEKYLPIKFKPLTAATSQRQKSSIATNVWIMRNSITPWPRHHLTAAQERRRGEPHPLLRSNLLLIFSSCPQLPQQYISSVSFLQRQRLRLSHSSASNHLTDDSLHLSWVAGTHKRCRVNTLDRQIQAGRLKCPNV